MVMDSSMNNLTAASCSVGLITINPTFWSQLSENQKQNLIFHEMGKCVLGRANRNDMNNGLPLSIMNSSLIPSVAYSLNSAQYLYELFSEKDLTSALPLQAN